MAGRLVGVTMARNEADIIEAFVRHNLRYLDEILVLDHGSSDATGDILRALQAEGLPLAVVVPSAREPIFKQADWTTRLARQAFEEHAADHVFPIDADEFLRVDSRAALDTALDRTPVPVSSLAWPTYVCNGDESGHPLHVMRWRVDVAPGRLRKIVVSRRIGLAPGWKLAPGNHQLWIDADQAWDGGANHLLQGVELAHLPLRSPEQLVAKALIGRLARRLTAGPAIDSTMTSWHFRELYERIMGGLEITPTVVRDCAVAIYALAVKPGELDATRIRFIADPFAEPAPLRYTRNDAVKPALLLAAWAYSLVERVTPQSPAHG